jgi:hypothetical protein
MAGPKPIVNQRDVVILQREETNAVWEEIHISGSGLMFFTDPTTGNLTADTITNFMSTYSPPAPPSSTAVSASWASQSFAATSASWASSSYTSSFMGDRGPFDPYMFTASWASQSVSASWAPGSTAVDAVASSSWSSQSFAATSASWASASYSATSTVSASWASQSFAATSASWASQSFAATSASWASQSFTATSASWASQSFSATSASWASQSFAATSASWASASYTASYIYPGAFNNVILPLEYKFDTTTGAGDPGSGKFRFNSAAPASIANIYVDDITNGGLDDSTIFSRFRSGSTQLYIQQKDDAANAFLFTVSDTPADNTGWFTIPVSYDTSIGVVPGNNKPCAFVVINRFYIATGSTYQITASWAESASWAQDAAAADSSSWSSQSFAATSATSASWASASYTASQAVSASWAETASWSPGGTAADYTSSLFGTASWAVDTVNGAAPDYTSSLFGTASWAENAVSASWAPGSTAVNAVASASWASASYIAISASWASASYTASNILYSGKTNNSLPKWSNNQLTNESGFSDISDVTASTTIQIKPTNILFNISGSPNLINDVSFEFQDGLALAIALSIRQNDINFSAHAIPTSVYDLGSTESFWNTLYVTNITSSNGMFGTASWAVSSSWAETASWAPVGAAATYTSSLFGTASWATKAVSSSWAETASWAPVGAAATYTSSLFGTASWAENAVSATYAPPTPSDVAISASWASASYTASTAISASYLSGSYSVVKNFDVVDLLQFTTATKRIRVGNFAGMVSPISATDATQIGYQAGLNSTNAAGATQIGSQAGINSTTATNATQVGFQAGQNSGTATQAVQIGNQAGYNATTATEAVQVGYNAGFNAAFGAYTTFIGSNADTLAAGLNVAKSIAIGYNAKVSSSNICVIGGTGADAVKVTIGGTTATNTLDVIGNISASSVTASLQGTASWAENAISASWAPDGAAATYTSSLFGTASWAQNAPYGRSIVLCAAYTPTATGADPAEIPVPYSPLNGTTPVTWSIRRLVIRSSTAETSTSSINIEKSSITQSFSATLVGAVTHSYGLFETASVGSFGTVVSGDKLRFNVITLGVSTYWTVVVEASYP